jgi:hypothetical protein
VSKAPGFAGGSLLRALVVPQGSGRRITLPRSAPSARSSLSRLRRTESAGRLLERVFDTLSRKLQVRSGKGPGPGGAGQRGSWRAALEALHGSRARIGKALARCGAQRRAAKSARSVWLPDPGSNQGPTDQHSGFGGLSWRTPLRYIGRALCRRRRRWAWCRRSHGWRRGSRRETRGMASAASWFNVPEPPRRDLDVARRPGLTSSSPPTGSPALKAARRARTARAARTRCGSRRSSRAPG